MPDFGVLHRPPSDPLVRLLLDDLGVPFHPMPDGRFRHPVGRSVARHVHRFQVCQPPRQLFEIAPVAVDIRPWSANRHGMLDPYTATRSG
jgi:hypothetical protein